MIPSTDVEVAFRWRIAPNLSTIGTEQQTNGAVVCECLSGQGNNRKEYKTLGQEYRHKEGSIKTLIPQGVDIMHICIYSENCQLSAIENGHS